MRRRAARPLQFRFLLSALEEAATGWFRSEGDHDIPQIERVVSQDDGYTVVEKLIVEDDMEETDPRSDGSDGSRPAGG